MNPISTGVYEYTLARVDGGTTYTATITVLYNPETYTFAIVAVPNVTRAEVRWPDGSRTILNQLMSLAALITLI